MLFLVEGLYAVTGTVVISELRLVFGLVKFRFVVPHLSFYDVHCKERTLSLVHEVYDRDECSNRRQ